MTDRVWNSGPPPHVGWWNASPFRRPDMWRWWDGEKWSIAVKEGVPPVLAAGSAQIPKPYEMGDDLEWSDYWPTDARVPRVDPSKPVEEEKLPEPMDKGPWTVTDRGKRIESDDFTHDVSLTVAGDFVSDEERIAYSTQLAEKLNSTSRAEQRQEAFDHRQAANSALREASKRSASIAKVAIQQRHDLEWNSIQVATWIGNQLMHQPSMFERSEVCKYVRSLGRHPTLQKHMQRQEDWVELTNDDRERAAKEFGNFVLPVPRSPEFWFLRGMRAAETKLREKNGGVK